MLVSTRRIVILENRQNVHKGSGNVRRDNNSDSHKVKEVDGNRLDLPNDGKEK